MRKIKKIFHYLLLLILSVFLCGCIVTDNQVDLRKALEDTINNISSDYDLENITDDLEFRGINDNYIYKFISSDESVISNTGKVNRQSYIVEVTIIVRVYQNDVFLQDSFTCLVIPIETTDDYQGLRYALDNIIDNILSRYDLSNIISDLEFLGTNNDYNYEFLSSNENIISNTGKVTRQSNDEEVIITIIISKDGLSLQEQLECIVKAIVVTDGYTYDVENTKSKLKISELNIVQEDEEYNNYLDVIAYIYYYHKLPKNYLTKSQAKSLGWSGNGNVWVNASLKGKNIGGDVFNNYEQILPILSNKPYVEVDVNCSSGNRGKYRIVYNKYTFDIYYTDDHYESFTYMIGVSNG